MFKDILSTIGAIKGKLDKSMIDESGNISPIFYITEEFSRLGNNVITQSDGLNYMRIVFENTGVYVEVRGFEAMKNLHSINYISDIQIQIDAIDSIFNMVHVVVFNNGKVTKVKHKGSNYIEYKLHNRS